MVGYVPRMQDLNLTGLEVKDEAVTQAMKVDLGDWQDELESVKEWYEKLGPTLPRPLELQRQLLLERVKTARKISK